MHEPIPMHDVASRPALGGTALGRRELVNLGVRWTIGIVLFLVAMMLVAEWLRTPLEALGKSFVARFGYAGMTFGTFIADGFHFPIPPQFYMLVGVSSGQPDLATLGAIACGSLPGGLLGFCLARRLAHIRAISKKLERSTALVERTFERFGYGAALLASLSPIPYSVLCQISGAHRLQWRFFALLSLCRLPRICFFYWIVRASWG